MGFMDDARARVRGRGIRIVLRRRAPRSARSAPRRCCATRTSRAPILVGAEADGPRAARSELGRAARGHRGARSVARPAARRATRRAYHELREAQGRDRGGGARRGPRCPHYFAALMVRAGDADGLRLRPRQRDQAVHPRLRGREAARGLQARLVGLHHGLAGARALLRRLLGEHRARRRRRWPRSAAPPRPPRARSASSRGWPSCPSPPAAARRTRGRPRRQAVGARCARRSPASPWTASCSSTPPSCPAVAEKKCPDSPLAGRGQRLRLPGPQRRQHRLQDHGAAGRGGRHRPHPPGAAPAGERRLARLLGAGPRRRGGDHRRAGAGREDAGRAPGPAEAAAPSAALGAGRPRDRDRRPPRARGAVRRRSWSTAIARSIYPRIAAVADRGHGLGCPFSDRRGGRPSLSARRRARRRRARDVGRVVHAPAAASAPSAIR